MTASVKGDPRPGRRPALLLPATAAVILATLAPSPLPGAGSLLGKKVLYLDSYHAEYAPGLLQRREVRRILEPEGVTIRECYLDEKRRGDDASLRKAADQALAAIREFGPDLVIASDDPASRYVVAPFLKNAPLPVIFIGVNWTVEPYGYPYPNVTGQIEVELIHDLVALLRSHARGKRLALLSGDTLTDRLALDQYRARGIVFQEERLVKTFAEWTQAYRELQSRTDAIVFRNNSGIAAWDDAAARALVLEETRVPTGTVSVHLGPWVLIGLLKDNAEFGQWAAGTALEVLRGKPPSQIPLTANRRGQIILNMRLAKKLSLTFPMELLERATFVEEPR
jgi:ABC-type uncharacterized transport system substrate-binding protein